MQPKRPRGNPSWQRGGASPNPSGRSRSDALTSRFRTDGWHSTITGIGQYGTDKRIGMGYCANIISPEMALELWRGNDIVAKAIELLPSNMLREGYDLQLQGESKDLSETLHDDLEQLKLDEHLFNALCYKRAYGGSAIYLGVDDGRAPNEPLNEDGIKSFDWIVTLEAREIIPTRWYNDIRNPKFGQPSRYQITPYMQGMNEESQIDSNSLMDIHETRLIPFMGNRVSRRQPTSTGTTGWGDNIITRMFDVLQDFDNAWNSAGLLVYDFAQPVFKMKGLAQLVAKSGASGADELKVRMMALALSRSIARTALIDLDEEFKREQTPVSGLPELLDRFATRLACSVDTPVTLLMGMSPAGLNATGESDIRFYYDKCKSEQPKQLTSPIRRVVELKAKARKVNLPKFTVKYRPLWQMTDMESADLRLKQQQTDSGYIKDQVLDPREVRKSRFAGDGYSTETQIDPALDAELEADLAAPEPEVVETAPALTPEEAQAKPKPQRRDYDPDQPRDEQGRFGEGGGGSEKSASAQRKERAQTTYKERSTHIEQQKQEKLSALKAPQSTEERVAHETTRSAIEQEANDAENAALDEAALEDIGADLDDALESIASDDELAGAERHAAIEHAKAIYAADVELHHATAADERFSTEDVEYDVYAAKETLAAAKSSQKEWARELKRAESTHAKLLARQHQLETEKGTTLEHYRNSDDEDDDFSELNSALEESESELEEARNGADTSEVTEAEATLAAAKQKLTEAKAQKKVLNKRVVAAEKARDALDDD